MAITRDDVFGIIDAERAWQQAKWRDLDDRNNVADFLVYMQRYLRQAMEDNNPDYPQASLKAVMKTAALGVACLEKFGMDGQLKTKETI